MNNGDDLKDDLETLSPEAEIQKAYDQAQKTPWTIARHSAAMSMDCSILSGLFAPEIDSLKEKGTYPNALRDVVIVTWLLSLTEAEVIRINTRQNKGEAIGEAFLWAEKEQIRYGSPKYLDGVRTMAEIVASIFTSSYSVEGKKEPPRKNDSSPPGRSAQLTTRSKPAGTTPTTSKTK